jgi:hypothetical protein
MRFVGIRRDTWESKTKAKFLRLTLPDLKLVTEPSSAIKDVPTDRRTQLGTGRSCRFDAGIEPAHAALSAYPMSDSGLLPKIGQPYLPSPTMHQSKHLTHALATKPLWANPDT